MTSEMCSICAALEENHLLEISSFLIAQMTICLQEAGKHKLPSTAKASVWSSFHRLRESKQIADKWSRFIDTLPSTLELEPSLSPQLILDRIIKKLINNSAEAIQQSEASRGGSSRPMDRIETNTIRYMAGLPGYIAVKLLKKYKRKARDLRLQLKRHLFVSVLRRMKADNQPGQPDSPLEYTEQWTKLIDRGGLYHISDDVFKLVENIEVAVRRHLNTGAMLTYTSVI
jgi:hypothetical protein